jgi:hypothetical protein
MTNSENRRQVATNIDVLGEIDGKPSTNPANTLNVETDVVVADNAALLPSYLPVPMAAGLPSSAPLPISVRCQQPIILRQSTQHTRMAENIAISFSLPIHTPADDSTTTEESKATEISDKTLFRIKQQIERKSKRNCKTPEMIGKVMVKKNIIDNRKPPPSTVNTIEMIEPPPALGNTTEILDHTSNVSNTVLPSQQSDEVLFDHTSTEYGITESTIG